jgi:hypothetical protein
MEKIFVLVEYGKHTYTSNNFVYVVHELLSIILLRYQHQQVVTTDLFIEEIEKDIRDIGKRFDYIKNTFKYNLQRNTIIDKKNSEIYISDEVCQDLLQQIKQLSFCITDIKLIDNTKFDNLISQNVISDRFKTNQQISQNDQVNQAKLQQKDLYNSKNIDKFLLDTTEQLKNTLSNFSSISLIPPSHGSKDNAYDTEHKKNNDHHKCEESCDDNDENEENDKNDKNDENELMEKMKIDKENTEYVKELELIKTQIELLQKVKIDGAKCVDEIKSYHDTEKNNYADFVKDVNYKKKKQFIEREREIERRRRYLAQKRAYIMFKNDVDSGNKKKEDLSELFENEYKIFEYMNNNNIIDLDKLMLKQRSNKDKENDCVSDQEENSELAIDNDYYIFNELMATLKESTTDNSDPNTTTFIPHNYYYLCEKDKDKYEKVKEQIHGDKLLDDFVLHNTTIAKNVKNYENKSLKDILYDIDKYENNDTDLPDLKSNSHKKHDIFESYDVKSYHENDSQDESDDDIFDIKKVQTIGYR